MKQRIRNICDLLLGLLFISSVLIGYYKDVRYMSEYCFISGMLVGSIFVTSFLFGVFKKKVLPTWLYFDCMISIIIILVATLVIGLSLEGAFWFIHIINPILLFIYWIVFCNHMEIKKALLVLTDIVFPICYFVFAFILWKIVGICPFPASLILVNSSPLQVGLGVGLVVVIFIALGYALHFFNKKICGKN